MAPTHLAGRLLAEVMAGQAERFDLFARLGHLPFPDGTTGCKDHP
jgi:gamma-glutamylputrescine oxidase